MALLQCAGVVSGVTQRSKTGSKPAQHRKGNEVESEVNSWINRHLTAGHPTAAVHTETHSSYCNHISSQNNNYTF